MTQIQTPDRRQIPLSAVATIQEDRGPNFVMRENVQRRIVVQSNVSGRRLAQRGQRHSGARHQNVKLPQGYHVEYGGQFESEAQASRQLLWLSLGVVVAIFFILSAAFGSSRDGLLIMINLPLALIGGVIGVYLAGGVLSVASIVGFITLFGIATRNGIMLVSHIRHLQEHEGVTDFRTAVIRGATERLVPILMTALAAGLALVPIALSAGEPGSEIQAPMAMVLIFVFAARPARAVGVVHFFFFCVGLARPPEAPGRVPSTSLTKGVMAGLTLGGGVVGGVVVAAGSARARRTCRRTTRRSSTRCSAPATSMTAS